ncbi:hypothetical protein AWB77_05426 [Caballeronia fortuita]|uniref:Uncharacterized protein n=1 Tax=Caballeronia fortuita TaxID=1777138 RepID=A0A158DJK3_9BURK|nr:DUF2946 domain-containing protein [Caballeronia fortuita]SAK94590.1 hypothetical protein AWB77_05426 [Caballeronia fortuita]
MTRTARNRIVAWLGIAAMWLAIVAPVVSQTLAARDIAGDPQALLCAVDAAAADAHAGHHDAAKHFDACSYCGLLAHDLPVVMRIAHELTLTERVARASVSVNVVTAAAKSFNAARPRAPPAFV